MKLEFYIEAIYYHPENPIPSVIISIKNNIEAANEPIIIGSRDDMKKALMDLFRDSTRTHKTSFVVGLEEYRRSGMMVGDRLEIDMIVKNNGEIKN